MERHNSRNKRKEASEFTEKVIQIDRVNKVVKGGKRLSFRALVIVGDNKGKVGIALGKSREVPSAIRKGIDRAKKQLATVNIVGGTIPHMVLGQYGASKVILKPAKQGTGVIAGGSVRTLLEAAGLKNIVAKSITSGSAINTAKAALAGLMMLRNLETEIKLRGKQLPVRLPRTIVEPTPVVSVSVDAAKPSNKSDKTARPRLKTDRDVKPAVKAKVVTTATVSEEKPIEKETADDSN
jgi:small subunit ribosomal protein S5